MKPTQKEIEHYNSLWDKYINTEYGNEKITQKIFEMERKYGYEAFIPEKVEVEQEQPRETPIKHYISFQNKIVHCSGDREDREFMGSEKTNFIINN